MFDDVQKYHVLRTILASTSLNVMGVCTMTSNNKISTTYVDSVCYDSFGCCSDIVSDRSVGGSLPSKAADQVDISTLSNAIAAPTLARNIQKACKHCSTNFCFAGNLTDLLILQEVLMGVFLAIFCTFIVTSIQCCIAVTIVDSRS